MSPSPPSCPPLAVLNPAGRDPYLDYPAGVPPFQPGIHPPVNFHAFAACSRGAFCQSTPELLSQAPVRFRHVLLLLRRRLGPCLDAAKALRAAGLHVLVSWKECGFAQVSAQLDHPSLWSTYAGILSLTQGIVSPTGVPFPVPPHLDPPPFHPLPTPYPVDLPDWDFSVPISQRSGLFLGTREFLQPSRNHLSALTLALSAARRTSSHVTVINSEKRRGQSLLRALSAGLPSGTLRVLEGRLPYDAYLRTLASHRVVVQLDRSAVPGQVAGDALLCRSVCVGGNGTIEQIAFPDLSPPSLAESALETRLSSLLTDDRDLQAAIDASQALAAKHLSFAAGARALSAILPAR